MSDDLNENLFLHAIKASSSVNALQHEMSESFWRDWFAGQAAPAILKQWTGNDTDTVYGEVARNCYRFADAMLEARKR